MFKFSYCFYSTLFIVIFHSGDKYEVQLLSVPSKFEINSNSAILHIRDWQFSLTQGIPPRLLGNKYFIRSIFFSLLTIAILNHV